MNASELTIRWPVRSVRTPYGTRATLFLENLRFIPHLTSKCGKLTIENEDGYESELEATRWLLGHLERVVILEADYEDIKEMMI